VPASFARMASSRSARRWNMPTTRRRSSKARRTRTCGSCHSARCLRCRRRRSSGWRASGGASGLRPMAPRPLSRLRHRRPDEIGSPSPARRREVVATHPGLLRTLVRYRRLEPRVRQPLGSPYVAAARSTISRVGAVMTETR
jgi:hypothetical protein